MDYLSKYNTTSTGTVCTRTCMIENQTTTTTMSKNESNIKYTMAVQHDEVAIRRPLRTSDDVFFVNCDRLALQSTEAIAISYIDDYDNNHDYNNEEDNDSNQNENQSINNHHQRYHCSFPACNETFDTLNDSQVHYETYHFFQCNECRRCNVASSTSSSFPNEHLLDLHLQEVHDCYFEIALEKKKISLSCLLIHCTCKFHSDLERMKHLHDVHGYPKWFRFHSTKRHGRNNNNKYSDRRRQYNVRSHGNQASANTSTTSINWWHNKRIQYSNRQNKLINDVNNDMTTNNDTDETIIESISGNINTNENPERQENNDNKKEKLGKRKERKKKINASIPCRFYNSKGGCWRGVNCMFLHESTFIDKNKRSDENNKMDICTEINELTEQMKTRARINVPNNISFGRRRR